MQRDQTRGRAEARRAHRRLARLGHEVVIVPTADVRLVTLEPVDLRFDRLAEARVVRAQFQLFGERLRCISVGPDIVEQRPGIAAGFAVLDEVFEAAVVRLAGAGFARGHDAEGSRRDAERIVRARHHRVQRAVSCR